MSRSYNNHFLRYSYYIFILAHLMRMLWAVPSVPRKTFIENGYEYTYEEEDINNTTESLANESSNILEDLNLTKNQMTLTLPKSEYHDVTNYLDDESIILSSLGITGLNKTNQNNPNVVSDMKEPDDFLLLPPQNILTDNQNDDIEVRHRDSGRITTDDIKTTTSLKNTLGIVPHQNENRKEIPTDLFDIGNNIMKNVNLRRLSDTTDLKMEGRRANIMDLNLNQSAANKTQGIADVKVPGMAIADDNSSTSTNFNTSMDSTSVSGDITSIPPRRPSQLALFENNRIKFEPIKGPTNPGSNSDFYIPKEIEDSSNLEVRKSEGKVLDTFNIKGFYQDCNDGKGCFGDTKNCITKRSCQAVVSYQPTLDMNGVIIELLGRTSKYIALGLSDDKLMGNDSVFECQVENNENIKIYRSFNIADDDRTEERTNTRLKDHSAISYVTGSYNGEWLYCNFQLKKVTSINTGTSIFNFNLDKDKFYLQLARGNSVNDNKVSIGYHDLGTSVSPEMRMLMAETGETRLGKMLEKLHGISVLFAWIFILPVSTFMMRYLKDSYTETYILNFSIWFGVHVILNGIVVGLTLSAMILIMIPINGNIGKNGWNHHNICAVVLCFLVLFQLTFGIVVYICRHSVAPWICRTHSILGHLIFFLSCYTIIYLSRQIRHGLPCATRPILISWIVIYFVIHLITSYQICYVDYIQGAEASRVYALSGLEPAPVTEVEPVAPGGTMKKVLLGTMTVIGLVSATTLAVMYGIEMPDCVRVSENN